jgi:hypothetical protein
MHNNSIALPGLQVKQHKEEYEDYDNLCVIILTIMFNSCSQDSVVGIATGYGLDDKGVGIRVPVESRVFSRLSTLVLGHTQPPIQ